MANMFISVNIRAEVIDEHESLRYICLVINYQVSWYDRVLKSPREAIHNSFLMVWACSRVFNFECFYLSIDGTTWCSLGDILIGPFLRIEVSLL